MRKTDKSAKLNKPPKAKVEGGGIGTLKPSKEEIAVKYFIIMIEKSIVLLNILKKKQCLLLNI